MQKAPVHRFRSLDALRGIAALIVVVHHLALAVPEAARDALPSLSSPFILSGRFCVMVFFVLSGFVLALPYFDHDRVRYGPYLVRRICRVFIPFAFAVLLSAVFCAALGGPELPMFSTWLNKFWTVPVTGQLIAQQVMMSGIDGPKSTSLDPPIWSLIVEMRISILFPLLVLCVRRFGWASIAAALILAYSCGKLQIAIGEKTASNVPESIPATFLFTLRYVVLFLLGIIMAARLNAMKELTRSLSPKRHGTVLALLVALWLVLAYKDFETSHSGTVDVFCGVFAMYLIALCVTFPKVSLRLSGPVWLWLGNISYSLYLIHMPVMLALFYLLYRHASMPVMIAAAVPASLLAAHIMQRFVERPSIVLGRKLSAAIKAAG